jgi:hypothetical protein
MQTSQETPLPLAARPPYPPVVVSNTYRPLPLVAAPLGRFEPRRPRHVLPRIPCFGKLVGQTVVFVVCHPSRGPRDIRLMRLVGPSPPPSEVCAPPLCVPKTSNPDLAGGQSLRTIPVSGASETSPRLLAKNHIWIPCWISPVELLGGRHRRRPFL